MFAFPPTVEIYLALDPVDLRKGFEGLSSIVRGALKKDPLSGHLFCFVNKRRNRCKILFFDRSGYWIFYKRLEIGTFKLPSSTYGHLIEMEVADLLLMLEGIDLKNAKRRRRWIRGQSSATVSKL